MSLRPPMVRKTWIDRPRLLQRLDEMADSQVLLVVAPAGYGKTTLVSQWAAGRDPATVVWVRLERADDDPSRLWSRLVVASELVGCRIDGDVTEFSPGDLDRGRRPVCASERQRPCRGGAGSDDCCGGLPCGAVDRGP